MAAVAAGMAAGRAATALVRSLGMTKMAAPPHRRLGSSSSPTPPPPPNMKAQHEGDPKRSRPTLGDRFADALFKAIEMSLGIWPDYRWRLVRPPLEALDHRIAALERCKMEDDDKKAVYDTGTQQLERILNEELGGPNAKISES